MKNRIVPEAWTAPPPSEEFEQSQTVEGELVYDENHSHLRTETVVKTSHPSLNQAPLRQWRRVADHGARHPRLQELGFLPLENVRVLQRSWLSGGALVVQVGDAVFGLRPDEAEQIPLQPHAA